MSGLMGDFCGKIEFDVLHFTNSPNAPPLDSMEFLGLK
jgi:hypothetical protein